MPPMVRKWRRPGTRGPIANNRLRIGVQFLALSRHPSFLLMVPPESEFAFPQIHFQLESSPT
jgi:hypothetical protein